MSRPAFSTRLRFYMKTPFMLSSFSLHVLRRSVPCALVFATLTGCSSVGSVLEPEKIDYKSARQVAKPKLEVPPDLTQLRQDDRYALPETKRGTATASDYTAQAASKGTRNSIADGVAVAPGQLADVRVERAGNQRWLVVKQTPEMLWPRIKDFWQESGFVLAIELPAAGVMETDWAENRAKIPQDFIRNALGKVFDSLYSTGERDKFRTRLERTAEGTTEIYISHRGASEELTGQQKTGSMWTGRASDPELEAEFIGRLMAHLGASEKTAKQAIAEPAKVQQRARLAKEGKLSTLIVDETFDRAWRRVGLSLDRVGFTVEDRDRSRGLYFVRYVDQATDVERKANRPGFFSRLFSSKDDKKLALRYRILVKDDGASSVVSVQDEQGTPVSNANGDRILSLLNDQLK